MSRLNDLLRQVANKDPQLAKDLQRETDALAERRAFGLNFERHTPEAVELPGRPVRKNDKVRILPDRGQTPDKENERLFLVAKVFSEDGERRADVVAVDHPEDERSVPVEDLVVVAEFRDPTYPGLVSTGKIERGGDKPFHTVINSENYHALQALLYTHRGKVDAIYIDPPYNTGAKDWKYNNDYVESDDHYRHSKWLAMMERRLLLAKELLNPDDSVLIATIDEKEVHRLGLLLEQLFPEATVQMVTIVINHRGVARDREFTRVEEYAFFVFMGDAGPAKVADDLLTTVADSDPADEPVRWERLIKGSNNARRIDRPNLFYPVFVDPQSRSIAAVGDPLTLSESRESVVVPDGLTAVWPIARDGSEKRWQMSAETLRGHVSRGTAKVGSYDATNDRFSILYLNRGQLQRIDRGEIEVLGHDANGVVELKTVSRPARAGMTVWNRPSHNAGYHGSSIVSSLVPGRKFPYPKSLYSVEDALRFAVGGKKQATVLDFFAGSGTTSHAVFRLNRQDGGSRRSIVITNNEVAAEEQRRLVKEGRRPGDVEWEALGICDYITKPRVRAAITGATAAGTEVAGNYKFTDEFPMADGFDENVEFFTLTYESAMRVSSNREFPKIAPFLWLRSGSQGRRIHDLSSGWDVADTYGVIANLDLSEAFIKAVEAADQLTHVFIVTDEDRLFEAVVRQLPERVEPVRLYSSYLRNFEIEAGRAAAR